MERTAFLGIIMAAADATPYPTASSGSHRLPAGLAHKPRHTSLAKGWVPCLVDQPHFIPAALCSQYIPLLGTSPRGVTACGSDSLSLVFWCGKQTRLTSTIMAHTPPLAGHMWHPYAATVNIPGQTPTCFKCFLIPIQEMF